ncbi:tRNA 5-methoxyuridine(34)/uridine 5-oxyacetic acid(34) synthase CmoB [Candidatus Profftia tarda]|nr:tRNA 5-methoxyuridine(34)/uridine 5-oxyacetic acid(34) synthase CmoB [Candidatus Profftia tarda]
MINFFNFYKQITNTSLRHWLDVLPEQLNIWQRSASLHSEFKYWLNCLERLPKITPYYLDLLNGVISHGESQLLSDHKVMIEKTLRLLMPWRKGPFHFYGIDINTEWRSDWKWERILPYISLLKGRTVLDVGCGNGYYLWRMIGAGAKLAIGIDPMQLLLCQFEAVRKLIGDDQRAHLLPLRIEQLPKIASFDTVFSMGVLYHRRSPFDHIQQLKNQLVKNGELVLETIVIEGDENKILVPDKRYAQMRNVYFIPSANFLVNWLKKCGLVDVCIVNSCVTTVDEQRRTDWMISKSLADFLDPNDHSKTIEGYPAPIRAVIVARKQ